MTDAREFDLIVYGASGYTGRQVVAHLERRSQRRSLRWAVAGRDRAKLAAIPGLSRDRIQLHADALDSAALEQLARRTRAIVNLAGPYTGRADALLAACIRGRTHYADLCGELPFMRQMIERHHEAAVDAGVKLIMACGFESLPFDFLVAAVNARFMQLDGSRCQEADVRLEYVIRPEALLGGHNLTGGSLATMLTLTRLDTPCDVCDPLALAPVPGGAAAPIELGARREAGRWLAPVFPLPFVNPGVVHRSDGLARLAGGGYAPSFRYREAFDMTSFLRPSPLAAAAANGCSAAMRWLSAMARGRRDRTDRVLAKVLAFAAPAPGKGPALAALDGMDYRLVAHARSESGRKIEAVLDAAGHPGYRSSANIIAEAGIALATEPEAGQPGVVTPSIGLSTRFLEHFADAGMGICLE